MTLRLLIAALLLTVSFGASAPLFAQDKPKAGEATADDAKKDDKKADAKKDDKKGEGEDTEMDEEELEQLRELGYVE